MDENKKQISIMWAIIVLEMIVTGLCLIIGWMFNYVVLLIIGFVCAIEAGKNMKLLEFLYDEREIIEDKELEIFFKGKEDEQ